MSDKDDAWTVFLEEREQLIRFWDSLGKPVLVLTGDIHNRFAIRITDRVWEFARVHMIRETTSPPVKGTAPPTACSIPEAFPRPHVVVQFYDGFTGDLLSAEPLVR